MLKLITFCALAAAVTPVAAQASDTPAAPKMVTITVTDAAFGADGSQRLCLPRTAIDRSRKSTLPKTMCHTRSEWEAKGVAFETRQKRQ